MDNEKFGILYNHVLNLLIKDDPELVGPELYAKALMKTQELYDETE